MVKKVISIFLSLSLISFVTVPAVAVELGPVKNTGRVQTIQKFRNLSNGNLKLKEKNGHLFLSGKLSSKQVAGEKSATKFLEENKRIFGIDNATKELKIVEVKKEKTGDVFAKYTQVIKGIKVNNSSVNVHFDKNGIIVSVNGKLEKNKTMTTIGTKMLSESEAIEIAKKQYTYKSLRNTPKTERLILTKDNKNYEVFKVNISYMEPTIANYDVYVEAHSGKIIQTENNIRYDGTTTGSGVDVNSHTKNLNLYVSGTSYQMRDLTKTQTTSNINTYSLNHGISSGTMVSNNTNSFNTEDYKASVSAHYNAGKVVDFYKNLFSRNSLDNNGMAIKSFTHYGNSYNNAFWDGYEMVYGDGDGSTFTYLSGDLDVVGHEMTHGVISNTANLQYHNQSGALNESMADVFGVFISTYDKYNVASGQSWTFNAADWVVGDDIYTPHISGDALRSLSNPTLYGQPDNMSNYKSYSDNEYGDWGGVHTNSGIVNKAAYLMAKNIGMEKTAKIYYRALVNYMNPNTNFEDAKNCLVQAATDLYRTNSAEITAVNSAFNSVGVGQSAVEDPYEPNDTIQTAYPINSEATYQSYISTATDLDFYKLHINSTGDINITLSDLPSDYDLKLYDSSGNMVAQSINSGTQEDSIDFNASETGDYYIGVYSYSESSTTQKYSLKVSNENTVAVTGVSLNKTTASLKVGESTPLVATVSPTDATNKNVTWSSSDDSVATVDNTGKVTAVGNGATTITVATADGGYTANCSITVNNLTVSFNSQGGSAVASKTTDYNSAITAPAAPTKTGYTFSGWYKEAGCLKTWNFTTDKVTTDTILYAKWTINRNTVKFNSQGGSAVASKTADYNSTITSPAAPTKIGYTFGGWYKEAGSVNACNFAKDKVTTNTTLYARWTITTPAIPTSLKAASSSYNSINTSWNRVIGASGYEVYRSTSSAGTYTPISRTTGASYNNTGLTTNSNYYYKVRAYRMVGTLKVYSGYSTTISSKPIPAVPTSVKSVSSSYNSINTSWSAVTGANGYEVYRSTSRVGTYTSISRTTGASYNNTGITTNKNYYYKIRAYRMAGTVRVYSGYSTTISSKPIPTVPTNVKATRVSSKNIKLTWNKVTGANGYEVYRATSSRGTYGLLARTTYLYYTNSRLITGRTYYYKMRSYRTVGTTRVYSNWSVVIHAKP